MERYKRNWRKSLIDVHSLDPDFLSISQRDIAFLISDRRAVLEIFADPTALDGLVDLFVEMTLEFSYKCNQFIRVTQGDRERLVDTYRSYLGEMGRLIAEKDSAESLSKSLEELVSDHFVELRRHLDRLSADGLPSGEGSNVFLAPTVCKEYSPEFQLSILGIAPVGLMEPILDIGCGKSGRLVRYLRMNGLNAFGVDRVVEPTSHLMKADWLSFKVEPGSWGTVISHMAFSNHFVFQHLYRFGSPEDYARQYMAILASLKQGGSFWYAPGLSFIEDHLPEAQFSVTRHGVDLSAAERNRAAESFAAILPYAVQVRRVWSQPL